MQFNRLNSLRGDQRPPKTFASAEQTRLQVIYGDIPSAVGREPQVHRSEAVE
jgi:hypothetical protein